MKPFEYVTFIKQGKELTEEELKNFNPFLINKLYYYSGKEKEANILNYYWNIPKSLQWKLFVKLYKNVKNVRWIKKEKGRNK